MSRYIDADAVLKIIADNCPHDKGGYNTEEEMGAGAACYYIRKDVENIPAADVVEVIRCKDCVHWGGVTYGFVCREFSGIDTKICMGEDCYCSYGERKENTE